MKPPPLRRRLSLARASRVLWYSSSSAGSQLTEGLEGSDGVCCVLTKCQSRRRGRTDKGFLPSTVVPVPHDVHGADDPWRPRIDLDPLSELGDLLVERTAVGIVIDAPALVEQGVAVEDLAPVASLRRNRK